MKSGVMVGGRYRLERKLGDGGMSSVWEATDERQRGERVAIKLALPQGVAWDEFEARFRREVAIGKFLGQVPGFVSVLDWGKHGSRALWLAMDLIADAIELDLIDGTREHRLTLMARTAERVRDAHARGIVHRDLKPSNVLIRRTDGEVFLADFGLSKVVGGPAETLDLGTLTASGMTMGTLVYMAPEQMVDAKRAGPPADVFSMGVMLFVVLTGEMPFKGKTGEVVSSQQMLYSGRARPPSPRAVDPSIPLQLDMLCSRCMAGNPDDRPSGEELARALAVAAGLAPGRIEPPTRRM